MNEHSVCEKSLGSTGLTVGAVTVGTSSLGRDTVTGSVEEAVAVSTAIAMLSGSFTLVDTSNEYAAGRSETVLGLAMTGLRDADAERDASVQRRAGGIPDRISTARIMTKVDRDPITGVFDRERVLRSYEESLRRLGVDRVQILHLHDPYTVTFAEATGRGGAVEALLELRDSGAVDAIGIATGPIADLMNYVDTGAFDVLLSHNRFTLVDRSAQRLFDNARQRGMGVFNAAPFGAGILSRGPVPGATYGYRPASPELIAWVSRAEAVCREFGVTLPAAALHFSMRSPLVDSTVVGVSSPARLTELSAVAALEPPDDLWSALDALGPAPSPLAEQES